MEGLFVPYLQQHLALLVFFFFFFLLFRAVPVVYRSSQARELQPSPYATATATQDPSRICDLVHSSQQCQILNLLSEARDQTLLLMGS